MLKVASGQSFQIAQNVLGCQSFIYLAYNYHHESLPFIKLKNIDLAMGQQKDSFSKWDKRQHPALVHTLAPSSPSSAHTNRAHTQIWGMG